jgi:hypothetical protein
MTSNLNYWWVAKRDEILNITELVTKDDDVIIEAAKTAHKTGISPTAAEKLTEIIDSVDLKTDAGKALRLNIKQFIAQASNQYAEDINKEADSLRPVFNKITVLMEQTNKLNDLITKIGNENVTLHRQLDDLKIWRDTYANTEIKAKDQLLVEKGILEKELQKVKGENAELLQSKKNALNELGIEKTKIAYNLQSDNNILQEKVTTLTQEKTTLEQRVAALIQFEDNFKITQNQPPPPPSQTSVVGVVGVKRRLQELIQKKPCAEGMDDVIYVLLGERCKGNRMKFLQESLNKL